MFCSWAHSYLFCIDSPLKKIHANVYLAAAILMLACWELADLYLTGQEMILLTPWRCYRRS